MTERQHFAQKNNKLLRMKMMKKVNETMQKKKEKKMTGEIFLKNNFHFLN